MPKGGVARKINLLESLSCDKMSINLSLLPVNLNSFLLLLIIPLSFHLVSYLFSSYAVICQFLFLMTSLLATISPSFNFHPHSSPPYSLILSSPNLCAPPLLFLSPPLCYVCCLAALSFTCQLRSGLQSSNMTNCPVIYSHKHQHMHKYKHTHL